MWNIYWCHEYTQPQGRKPSGHLGGCRCAPEATAMWQMWQTNKWTVRQTDGQHHMAMVDVDSGSLYRQTLKSSGLVLGRWPLGVVLHSSNEPGELWQWLCHDDSIINIVLVLLLLLLSLSSSHKTPTSWWGLIKVACYTSLVACE